jgi:hypothetical protein
MYTIFSQFGKIHFDIYINVFPLYNKKASHVSGVRIEKEAKKPSMKSVAAAKHRLVSYIVTHDQ